MTERFEEVPVPGADPGAGTSASVHHSSADGAPEPGSAKQRFTTARAAILAADLTPKQRRQTLTDLTDSWLADLLPEREGVALVAVGGYGRRELLPGSDIDLVILHDGNRSDAELAAMADAVLYPMWDAGLAVDHSVRTPREGQQVAGEDIKAMLGMLDARHVIGDQSLSETLRTRVMADWRSRARKRLPELHVLVRERAEQHGTLAYLLEPDLSQSYGGLRDATVLRGITASWVADYPKRQAVAEAREWLLTVRDALHRITGRSSDRLLLHDQDELARRLGMFDADGLLRRVSEAGRAIAYSSDQIWHEVDRLLSRPRVLRRRPVRRPVAQNVVVQDGQVMLARNVRAEEHPLLPLRMAAAAAQHSLILGPATAEMLAASCPPLPTPWPSAARESLVSLLAAGESALPVWETLEWAGIVSDLLPGWDRIRFRPQRTPAHRFTVDRHSIGTAVEAAGLTRRVGRPDILLVAALLHDIGKGTRGDHSVVGAPQAADLARRMGFDRHDVNLVELLVRHHLLLPTTATTRDLDDPATIASVVGAVRHRENLELLAALTEADAKATGPIAWTPWRSGLVRELTRRVGMVIGGEPLPRKATLKRWEEDLALDKGMHVVVGPGDGEGLWRISVAAPSWRGMLGAVAGVAAMHRLQVRSASVHSRGERVVLVLHTENLVGSAPEAGRLHRELERVLNGDIDVMQRLQSRRRRREIALAPDTSITILPDASEDATVLEVRTADQPGLLSVLGYAVADAGAKVSAAVVGTVGAEAIDVLYVVDDDGRRLGARRAGALRDRLVRAVESASA